MVIRAALQAELPSDAEIGISEGSLTTWRESVLFWQRIAPNPTLLSFTFDADVTTLAEDYCFTGESQKLVARYSKYIAALAGRRVAPAEGPACPVAEDDSPLLPAVYQVLGRIQSGRCRRAPVH